MVSTVRLRLSVKTHGELLRLRALLSEAYREPLSADRTILEAGKLLEDVPSGTLLAMIETRKRARALPRVFVPGLP